MRPLRQFKEFVELGIVRRRALNVARSKSLREEAKRRKRFIDELVDKIGLTDENANYFIENSYDVLIELIRAKLLANGYHASGKGAHEAEVSFMRNLGFSEREVRFMNELRFFRNGILYYGEKFDRDYGKKVLTFLDKIYLRLTYK